MTRQAMETSEASRPVIAYQAAKRALNNLHPAERPSSLTRRGETLIARFYVSLWAARRQPAIEVSEAVEHITKLMPFPVKVLKSTIDNTPCVRVWFTY